jgi:hypothetical protein
MPELTRLQETHAEYRQYSWADFPHRKAVIHGVIEDQLSFQGSNRYGELLSEWHTLRGIRQQMCAVTIELRNGETDNARDLLQEIDASVPRNYRVARQMRRWISERLGNANDDIAGCHCCFTAGLQDDMRSNAGGEWFCEACIDGNEEVIITRDTGEPHMRDDCYSVYESRYEAVNNEPAFWVANRRWLERNNYINTDEYGWVSDEAYSELREEGDISNPDDYDEDSERDPAANPSSNEIICYHHSRHYVGHLPGFYDSAEPRLLMGLELEVEVDTDDDCNEMAYSVRQQLNGIDRYTPGVYCWTERDGSLEHGFEVVTGFGGLDVHEEHLQRLTRTSGLRSHDTNSCGLHVHLDRSNITALHAAKLVSFINDPTNGVFIQTIARRRNNSYGKITDKSGVVQNIVARRRDMRFGSKAEDYRRMEVVNAACGDRYEAVNFETDNYKTVEFRLFRGTLYVPTIMATLEFTRITYLFTRDLPLHQLKVEQFLQYIQRPEHRLETRYLRQYLLKRGYAVTCHANECAVPLAHQLERRFAA